MTRLERRDGTGERLLRLAISLTLMTIGPALEIRAWARQEPPPEVSPPPKRPLDSSPSQNAESAGRNEPLAALEEQLGSTEARRRLEAVNELAKMGAQALTLLRQASSDADEDVRARAIAAYCDIAGPEALPLLESLSGETSIPVLHGIFRSLSAMSTPPAVALFLKFFKVAPLSIRPYAISLLEPIQDPQLIPAAVEIARNDPNPNIRRGALYILRNQKSPETLELAKEKLKSNEPLLVREAAIQCLAALGCDTARPILAAALADEHAGVRELSASALSQVCDASASNDFVEILRWKDESGKVPKPTGLMKTTALSFLAKHPAPQAREVILGHLADQEPHVRRSAVGALSALGGQGLAAAVGPLVKDPDHSVREAVAHSMRIAPISEALPILTTLLQDERMDVRFATVHTLGEIRDQKTVEAVARMLLDKAPEVRVEAATALGQAGNPAVVPALVSAARDPIPLVRERVAEALGGLKDRRAVDILIESSKDSLPAVRAAAARSLGLIGDPRAKAALENNLKDADAGVRAAARDALKMLPAASSGKRG